MNFKKYFVNIFKRNIRYYSIKQVRVRFAPSPTGQLHLGGLRTALYNYLFARSNNGKFILRIEDTDQTRYVPGATKQLLDDLKWAGIIIDEGPENGGSYGPYTQSERLNIYRENVNVLLGNGFAYPCFCTERRLDLLRKEALRTRQIPKYDNRCRKMSEEEVQKRLNRKEKHCIRFKLLPDCETFEDMIYGNIAYDVALNEGDPVIIKADGYPTYHFANVVDDHLMDISHVLRGVEWQISTTKHILMYRAFKWEPPTFGHLPLLLNSDGTKLSKRQGDIHIASYRQNNIFPQALVNFVVDCGGGFNREQGIKLQSYSMDELISQFDIKRINSHSTKIYSEKLLEFNRLELIKQVENKENCKHVITDLQKLLKTHFSDKENNSLQLNEDYILSILKWATPRINKITDLLSKELSFLWIVPASKKQPTEDQIKILLSLNDNFKTKELHLEKEKLKMFFKDFCKKEEIPFNRLMKLMRTAISGLEEGPSVLEMVEILGIQNTVNRIEHFVHTYNKK